MTLNTVRLNTLFKALFFFSYAIILTFAALKITHTAVRFDKEVALAGSIMFAAFVVMSLLEIHGSKNIKMPEKVMWTLGFLFFNMITGIVYFFLARKRITRKPLLRSSFRPL